MTKILEVSKILTSYACCYAPHFRIIILIVNKVLVSLSLSAAGSEHRFLAVGIDFRWREIAFLAAALDPLAYLAASLGPLPWLS